MLVLQVGRAKSGNYWLWKILQLVFEQAGIERKAFIKKHPIYQQARNWEQLSHSDQVDIDVMDIEHNSCYFRIASRFREEIENIDDYLSKTSHVWTHSNFSNYCHELLPKFDKIIYIVRDPRDVAISMANFAFTPYVQQYNPHNEKNPETFLDNRIEWHVRNWAEHVGNWVKRADRYNIYIMFFERLKNNFDGEFRKLLRYLELHLDDRSIEMITQKVSLKNMKSTNPNHVRSGRSGGWLNVLNATQKCKVDKLIGQMLNALHYPKSSDIPTGDSEDFALASPYISRPIPQAELNQVLKSIRWSPIDILRGTTNLLLGRRSLKTKYHSAVRTLTRIVRNG